jgi:hypothetical protein
MRYYLSYPFHIPFPRLGEAFEILLSSLAEISSASPEMMRESLIKIPKMTLYPPKGAEGMTNSFLKFFMVPAGWGS